MRLLMLLGLCAATGFPLEAEPRQEAEPGLVAEYFAADRPIGEAPEFPANRKPTFVRVDPRIDFAAVTGEFHGTKLATHFFARWTGLIRCAKEGLYGFYVESDDGARLYVNDELVLDNRAGRAMEQKSDRVILPAGDHVLRFEYFQAAGAAGCNLQWKPPGKGREIVPAEVLFHRKGAKSVAWDRAAWEARPKAPGMEPAKLDKPGRYANTDYGSFLTRSFEGPPKAITAKGISIKVGPEAAVCFDPELLRISAAWTGRFVTFPTARDGIAGHLALGGTPAWSTPAGAPGWAKNGAWLDPRPFRAGPLPRDWARWRGLYVHGASTVLSYTVGDAEILEKPGFESGSFTRTFRIGATSTPLAALLAEGDVDAALIGAPPGAALRRNGARLELEIPPLSAPATFKVSIPKGAAAPPEDLEPLTKGGPSRWSEPVVLRGSVSRESGAYVVDTVPVPETNPWQSYMRISALDFFADGRAAAATLDGDVWIVSGIDATLERVSWKRFAAGLYQPLGLKVVDGVVHALGRDQITKLHDRNGDGEADFYENFNNDCMVSASFHEFASDLQTDREGNFYYAKAATLGYANATPHNGSLVKVSKDGSKLEIVAIGFRAPNGLCVGPRDEITITDQQGNWMATCPIFRVKPGGFYGFVLEPHPETKTRTRDPAFCWLPMDVDNSSGSQVWVMSDRWGPLSGKLLHTSYGQSRLFLVLDEGGLAQGGVVKIPLQFASGIMRAKVNPADGQVYVAGLRGWQTTGVRDGCLQRVRYTGKPARLPCSVAYRKTGLDIGFTDPVDGETAGDADSWSAEWFRVESTSDYGSAEFNPSDAKKRGRQKLAIASASVRPDGRTVSLEIPDLKPVTNLVLRFTIRAADGARMSHEIALTVNALPR